MRIKGILFDKDGTLIDFFSLWLYAARRVIPEFIRGNNLEEKQNTTELENVLYESIGIFRIKLIQTVPWLINLQGDCNRTWSGR